MLLSTLQDASDTRIVSGSWDGSAKIWSLADGSCLASLDGHENGVAVLGFPDGNTIATGSAGVQSQSSIVGFAYVCGTGGEKRVLKTLTDHGGPVRQLCMGADEASFYSCSNDGTVREWDLSGTPMRTLRTPTAPFVYGVCCSIRGTVAAACDDMCARVWEMETGSVQQIGHPCTVWCVCALDNGDFATGGSDGKIRIFSKDPARIATPDMLASYAAAVQASVESAAKRSSGKGNGVTAIDPTKLVSFFNAKPGTSEGEVKMFNKNGEAWAYQWSRSSATWIEIGPVVGGIARRRSSMAKSMIAFFPSSSKIQQLEARAS